MQSRRFSITRSLLLAGASCLALVALAGCDDRVTITRDRDTPILRHATWAWRPAEAPGRDSRRVISRDTMGRGEAVVRDTDANNEVVRQRVKTAFEQALAARGLTLVSDPATADFLADYHFAVERHNMTVAYPAGYPGIVCGPFGCWSGWGWGPPAYGFENIHFREGMIVFDFVKSASKNLVYRAVGEKPVRRDAFSLTQSEINDLVGHLLKDLKPRK